MITFLFWYYFVDVMGGKGIKQDKSYISRGGNSCLNRSKSTNVHVRVLEGQVLLLAHEFFLQKSVGMTRSDFSWDRSSQT